MAPNQKAVEWQTNEIIKYLLEDEDVDQCSPCSMSDVEADGPTRSDGEFDFYIDRCVTASSGCSVPR